MVGRLLSRSVLLAASAAIISSTATAQTQPFPGKYCQAETLVNGKRWLYRTSFIQPENLRVGGQPVEVDLLQNGEYAAHALTRYTGNFTFTGTTGTGTPLSLQFDPATERIQVTHAGRTITGNCGDLPSDIPQR